jgi:YHS domain-containing protein
MKKRLSIAILAIGLVATLGIVGCASHEHSTAEASGYPLTKCVVSGEDLGSTPYTFEHNGRTVKLCCKDCLAKFNQDPDKYMAMITPAK